MVELRQYVWATVEHTCWLCGQPIASFAEFEVDHVLPRSRGGSDELANLRPAHGRLSRARCNQRRGNRTGATVRPIIDATAWFTSHDADDR